MLLLFTKGGFGLIVKVESGLLTSTKNPKGEELPQVLLATTVALRLPGTVENQTKTESVPWPLKILSPEPNCHWYPEAPCTKGVVNNTAESPSHTWAGPATWPGAGGATEQSHSKAFQAPEGNQASMH